MHLTVTFACIPKLKVNLSTDTHGCPTQKKIMLWTENVNPEDYIIKSRTKENGMCDTCKGYFMKQLLTF